MAITTPVSFWKLDESSGNAADAVGSNTLTNTGVVYTTGKIGNAADFERGDSSDVLSIADGSQSGLDFSNKMSISAWLNLESIATSIGTIVSKWNPSAASQLSYRFSVDYTNSRLLLETSSTGSNELSSYCSWSPSTSTWYHVVVTYDGAASAGSRVKLYINGSSQTMGADAAPSSLFNSNQSFNIGNNGSTRAFDGLIDAVGVWNVVLSSTEVSELYNSGNGKQYPFGTDYTLAADAGSYSLTGTAAGLAAAAKLVADAGSYVITGTAAAIGRGYTIAADAGSYAIAGVDAALVTARKIAADAGGYALSGTDAALTAAWRMLAEAGTYVLTGLDAAITSNAWAKPTRDSSSFSKPTRDASSWTRPDDPYQ